MVTVRHLVWDEKNIAHIAAHHVTPEEVEQVCHGAFIVREGYHQRLVLIGPTANRRMLAVVLSPRGPESYYPVTAYPTGERGRRLYDRERGRETDD